MLNLLIVEDNDFERNALLRNIKWDILSVHVADTAFNGQDGLEKAARCKPDIVVSDVMMPVMNGIEMAKRLADVCPDVRFVFTSGYGDVALLRDAMEVRAYNYLIKPVKPEELTRIIKKMASEIIDEKLLKNENISMQLQYEENMDYLQEKFFESLLHSPKALENAGEIYSRAASLNIDLSGCYCMAMAELDFDGGSQPQASEYIYGLVKQMRIEFQTRHCLFIRVGDTGFAVFISFLDGEISAAEQLISAIAAKLEQEAGNGGFRFSIGVSESSGNIHEIPAIYRQCSVSAGMKIMVGYGHINKYGNLDEAHSDNEQECGANDYSQIYSSIADRVYAGENPEEQLQALAGGYGSAFRRLDRIKSLFVGFVSYLSQRMGEHGEYFAAISESDTGIYYNIITAATIPDILAYMKKILASLSVYLGRKRLNKDDYIINDVKSILSNDFDKPITLNYLSDKVYLSPNYLRILFKNKMGTSIQDYLTTIRISKAKELLKQGKYKVYEIGEKVGYPNNTYFNIAFKNFVDMTPGEYRSKFFIDRT